MTKVYPRRHDLRGLDLGSDFIRFRLFIWFIVQYRFSVIVWRCFCNRLGHLGGFGFFQRAVMMSTKKSFFLMPRSLR